MFGKIIAVIFFSCAVFCMSMNFKVKNADPSNPKANLWTKLFYACLGCILLGICIDKFTNF
jgi:predicted membrane channel-forming protein YqfA (hemolysin III family)